MFSSETEVNDVRPLNDERSPVTIVLDKDKNFKFDRLLISDKSPVVDVFGRIRSVNDMQYSNELRSKCLCFELELLFELKFSEYNFVILYLFKIANITLSLLTYILLLPGERFMLLPLLAEKFSSVK